MTQPNATAIDSHVYRDVFSTSAMRAVWSDQARIQAYLDVEKALSLVQARLGVIPENAAQEIGSHCKAEEMDWDKMKSQMEHIGYPVLPVVEQLTALCKDGLGQWCHWGATTQDITDTATVLQIRSALGLVEQDLSAIVGSLEALAAKYRDTPMIGRSNLQQAVPLTFGYKVAVWLAGLQRQQQRLAETKARVLMGEFGGAVGTLASLGDKGLPVQEALMQELGLKQPLIAWHTVRDTVAEVGCFLGLTCGLLDKIATDVKIMMATELAEVQEADGGGGRGAFQHDAAKTESNFVRVHHGLFKHRSSAYGGPAERNERGLRASDWNLGNRVDRVTGSLLLYGGRSGPGQVRAERSAGPS